MRDPRCGPVNAGLTRTRALHETGFMRTNRMHNYASDTVRMAVQKLVWGVSTIGNELVREVLLGSAARLPAMTRFRAGHSRPMALHVVLLPMQSIRR